MKEIFSILALFFVLTGFALPCIAEEGIEKSPNTIVEIDNTRSESSLRKILSDAFYHFRYRDVAEMYRKLPENERTDPELNYMAGFALMRQHDFVAAEAPLRTAINGHFSAYPKFPTAQELLNNVEVLIRMRPPLYELKDGEKLPFKIYARQTEWLQSMESEFPYYVERAKMLFGDTLPPITFYLFDNRTDFQECYFLLSHYHVANDSNATGLSNIVILCEVTAAGTSLGSNNSINHRKGVVLHEYCHSLCSTVFGDKFRSSVPHWFDEATADKLAEPYYINVKTDDEERLMRAAQAGPAPTYLTMTNNTRSAKRITYPIARQMLLEIIGTNNDSLQTIKRIIAKAIELDWNFNKAIEVVTGIPPENAYKKVIKRYWKNAAN